MTEKKNGWQESVDDMIHIQGLSEKERSEWIDAKTEASGYTDIEALSCVYACAIVNWSNALDARDAVQADLLDAQADNLTLRALASEDGSELAKEASVLRAQAKDLRLQAEAWRGR